MAKSKFSLSVLILTILLIIASGFPVHAQESVNRLTISGIDISEFPNIRLTLQATDIEKKPITDLLPNSINVSENGKQVDFSLAPYTAGVRVIFLIDCGLGIDGRGATGEAGYLEMKSVISNFLSRMNAADSIMILIQEGDKTNKVSDYSSSVTDLQSKLDGYACRANTASYGYLGLLSAISMIKDQKDGKTPFVVFLSQGIQSATKGGYDSVVNELFKVPSLTLHTVFFLGVMSESRLDELAQAGGGIYSIYKSKAAANEIIESIIDRRNQYLITYRSTNSENGNRKVTVTSSSSNIPTTIDYSIILQSPRVTIQDPLEGSTITRKAGTTAQGQTDIDKDFINVMISVDWPDGHPRKVVNVSVLVNNQTQGTTANPDLDNTGLLSVPWDLRAYTQIGQNPYSLQVQVTDELGLTGTSAIVPVVVLVQSDVCKGLPTFLCSAITLVSPYTNFIAIGIALVALALVIIFRRQIATMSAPIADRVSDFVERLTKPRTVSTPKAFLEVLKGSDSDRTTFEIYGKTPIGRSKRYAELVFHENEENSAIGRLHCTILDEDSFLTIRDEESQWGTYLNEIKLVPFEAKELHDGDIIELAQVERGGIKFRFSLANPSVETSDSNTASNSDMTIDEEDEARITKPRRR